MPDPFDFARPAERFAVMGNPVAHSLSPRIHLEFASQLDLRIEYTKIQVDVGGFGQAVSNFQASGGRGLNVTVPFKTEAFALADTVSERVRQARAANTLTLTAAGVVADNTDGIGLVRDIEHNLACRLVGRRVLLIGAGGAVRGVIGPLLDAAPAELVIANRTADKAAALEEQFADARLTGGGMDVIGPRPFDLVINGTAASLTGSVPSLPASVFGSGTLAYDMMYGPAAQGFVRWALESGAARAADGLGMLVEQAAESFLIWHGQRPETAAILEELRGAS